MQATAASVIPVRKVGMIVAVLGAMLVVALSSGQSATAGKPVDGSSDTGPLPIPVVESGDIAWLTPTHPSWLTPERQIQRRRGELTFGEPELQVGTTVTTEFTSSLENRVEIVSEDQRRSMTHKLGVSATYEARVDELDEETNAINQASVVLRSGQTEVEARGRSMSMRMHGIGNLYLVTPDEDEPGEYRATNADGSRVDSRSVRGVLNGAMEGLTGNAYLSSQIAGLTLGQGDTVELDNPALLLQDGALRGFGEQESTTVTLELMGMHRGARNAPRAAEFKMTASGEFTPQPGMTMSINLETTFVVVVSTSQVIQVEANGTFEFSGSGRDGDDSEMSGSGRMYVLAKNSYSITDGLRAE